MDHILDIKHQIENIKINLIKLSKGKRTKKLLEQKYLEAKSLYDEYIKYRDELNVNASKGYIKKEEINYLLVACEEIESFYQKIQTTCLVSDQDFSTMADFDMKTATSLLPIMTEDEEVTKKLIDCIEFYSQTIRKEHEQLLISFVLKTRLTKNAKLRLLSNYESSTELIADMKNNLLTKQSATALQIEMLKSRQGSQSIEEFGKKLEDLFVELTISQANGDDNAFKILRPVNEKLAIQRFTEGLRNSRLSTILAARNYSELKDVIRAAKDEELSRQGSFTSAETIFTTQHRGKYQPSYRGHSRGRVLNNARQHYTPNRSFRPMPNQISSLYHRGNNRGFTSNSRGRGHNFERAVSRGRNNNGRKQHGYLMNQSQNDIQVTTSENNQNLEFFRS